ncbi:MAG: hypothetical protein QXS00_04880 [Pyrobaculum sp.]
MRVRILKQRGGGPHSRDDLTKDAIKAGVDIIELYEEEVHRPAH